MKTKNTIHKEAKNIALGSAKDSILKQILALYEMPIPALKERYLALLPGANAPTNKGFLIHRIAHKLQEDAYGGLSASAKERLQGLKTELNPILDLGQRRTKNHVARAARRLPMAGSVITKTYKGRQIEVKVLHEGFEYNGKPYRSLSKIAKIVSGVHQSGFVFFGV